MTKVKKIVIYSMLALFLLGVFFTIHADPYFDILSIVANYVFLVGAVICALILGENTLRKYKKYKLLIKVAGYVIGVLIITIYAKLDYYKEYGKKTDGGALTAFVTDKFDRLSGNRIERAILLSNGDYSGGKMSGDRNNPQPHGVWKCCFDGIVTHDFYWYGEKISEGEWHLRNK